MGCGGSSEKKPEVEEKSGVPNVPKKNEETQKRKISDAPELIHVDSPAKSLGVEKVEEKEVEVVPPLQHSGIEDKHEGSGPAQDLADSFSNEVPSSTQIASKQADINPVPEVVESFQCVNLKSSWLSVELDEEKRSLLSEDMLEQLNECEVECAAVAYLLIADCNTDFLLQTIGVAVLISDKTDAFNDVLRKSGARLKGYGATPLFYERWRKVFFSLFPRYLSSGGTSFSPALSQEWSTLWEKMIAALYEGSRTLEGQVFDSLYRERNARRLAVDVGLICSRESRCDPTHRFCARLLNKAQQLIFGLPDTALINSNSVEFLFEVFCSMVSLLMCKPQLEEFFHKIKNTQGERLPPESYLIVLFQPFIDTSREFLPDVWNPAVEYNLSTHYYQMINLFASGRDSSQLGSSDYFPFLGGHDSKKALKLIEGFPFLDRRRTSSLEVHASAGEEAEVSQNRLCIQSSGVGTIEAAPTKEGGQNDVLGNRYPLKVRSLFGFGERASWAVVDLSRCSSLRMTEGKGEYEPYKREQCNPTTIPAQVPCEKAKEDNNKGVDRVYSTEETAPSSVCTVENPPHEVKKERNEASIIKTVNQPESEVPESQPDQSRNDPDGFLSPSVHQDTNEESGKLSNSSLFSSSMVVFANESVMGDEEEEISDSNTNHPLSRMIKPALDYGCVLCTNIEDSLILWRENSELMHKAQKNCNRLIRSVISRFGALEIKNEGDSFIIASQNIVRGLKVALGIQLELMRAVPITPGFRRSGANGLYYWSANHRKIEGEANCWNDQAPRVRIALQRCFEKKEKNIFKRKIRRDAKPRYQHYGASMESCALLETMACGGQILMTLETVKSIFTAPEFSLDPCDMFLRSVKESLPASEEAGKSLKDFVSFVDIGIRRISGTRKASLHLISVVPKCLEKRSFANYSTSS